MKITYRSFLLFILCFLLAFTSCACKAQKDDVPTQLAVTASALTPDETGVSSALGSVALTFNQALRAPADMSKITLKSTASEQTVSLSFAEVAGSGIFISLAERLSPSTAYELRLESGAVTSQTGLVMDEYKLNFTTGDEQNADTQPPVLLQTYPENNGQDFDPAGEILFLFDEPIMQGTNYEQIALVAADGASLPITKNIVGSQLTIRAEMKPDSSYNLLVADAALRDYAMNDFAEPIFLAFTTAGQPVQDDAAQAKPLTVSATVEKRRG